MGSRKDARAIWLITKHPIKSRNLPKHNANQPFVIPLREHCHIPTCEPSDP